MKTPDIGIVAGLMVILASIAGFLAVAAAWVTHVVACIQASAWVLLAFGCIVAPVGVIHGFGIWLRLF